MDIAWTITAEDIAVVRSVIERHAGNSMLNDRLTRNMAINKPHIDRARFWRALICARLTSQQKSGPDSPVARFGATIPFPLSYEVVRDATPIDGFIQSRLSAFKGLRFSNKIGREMAEAFRRLHSDADRGWDYVLTQCNRLTQRGELASAAEEREVANTLRNFLKGTGIGPKQVRNTLQALGLTRYEIPLDSRVMAWLRSHLQFPLPLNGTLLSDPTYYELVLDAVQTLCARAETYPCLLDAVMFSDGEADTWNAAQLIF